MSTIVWHRRDLRTTDNKALLEASKLGEGIVPVFVFEDRFFREGRYSKKRLDFLFKSLNDLEVQYLELGIDMYFFNGDSLDILPKLANTLDAKVFFNEDTNGVYGISRDKKASDLGFISFKNSAVQISGRSVDWSIQTRRFFESEIETLDMKHPSELGLDMKNRLKKFNPISISEYRNRVLKGFDYTQPIKPGSTGAHERLQEFSVIIKDYPKSISKPILSEEGTSRLSTHFSFGTISIREVYQKIDKLPFKQKRFYQTRLFWNQHFTQKLTNFPDMDKVPINPVFKEHWGEIFLPDKDLTQAWMEGKTGYPLIDASMRALTETGFLNFRMRAMVASFFVYILRQPWKIGADYMFEQLIDADKGINYSQWQMQSGMVGVHPNRIYNPTKQILDNDPQLEFIRKYLPEEKGVEDHVLIMDPIERDSSFFADKYYSPIVDFQERAKNIRKILKPINKEAFLLVQRDKSLRESMALSERASKRPAKNQNPDIKIV